jgi:BioD-like phosphotransacetylase family protein
MNTAEIILVIVLFVLSALLAFAGVRQLQCKGYCFNNAYIYASEKEREQTDFTPYYKQSGKVLLMVSGLFLLNALRIVFKLNFIFYVSLVLIAAIIAYAILSSIMIEKNK